MVALHRRDTAELLAEELRRLDPDEVYAETLSRLDARGVETGPAEAPEPDERVVS
jgi:glucose-6-phosphate dehydrogenase assembly protein OpcA